MDKQLWVTRYHPDEMYPEGKYPNRSTHDTGLGQYSKDNESLNDQDNVIWMTTGTTHRRPCRGVADNADGMGAHVTQAVEFL